MSAELLAELRARGYTIVPINTTPEMNVAGVRAMRGGYLPRAWTAMLSAAPSPRTVLDAAAEKVRWMRAAEIFKREQESQCPTKY